MSRPAVGRWTKPGFLARKKRVDFGLTRQAYTKAPVTLEVQGVRLRWEDTAWMNMGLDEQPSNAHLSADRIHQVTEENEKLKVECEILLHMLTALEIKKAKNRRMLADKRQIILGLIERAERPRTASDSDEI